jgi:hypothetical protein
MKNFITLLFCLFTFITFSQERIDSKLVDEHLKAQLERKGNIGIESSEMSVYANENELQEFLENYKSQQYLTFPELKERPVRLFDGIPDIWAKRDAQSLTSFHAQVNPGEYFVFQIGVYAKDKKLVKLSYESDLDWITCFNLEGIDDKGNVFQKNLDLEKEQVQALWFGIQIPETAKGNLTGSITISCSNAPSTTVNIKLVAVGEVVQNSGYNDGNRLSRLSWLNSTIGHDNNVTKGFVPIIRKGGTFSFLGREVGLDTNGLPASINSFFGANNQKLGETAAPILSDKFCFLIETTHGELIQLKPGNILFTKEEPSTLEWEVLCSSGSLDLLVKGKAEFDGSFDYQMELKAKKTLSVKDIRLEIPMTAEKSKYMMGMGKEGGLRPGKWNWKWDVENKSQDAVWVGGVNGGLRIKLKDEDYHRQLVNIYYQFNPLNLPKSWGNKNRGGCDIYTQDNGTTIKAYSGQRELAKGETLNFNFELLITPLKLINNAVLFDDRFYHSDADESVDYIQTALNAGADIINIHSKKDIYPFINYPYLEENVPALTGFIETAHQNNLRAKVYYTTREITVNMPEIWAMRSLNGEIIFPGPGKDTRTIIHKNGPHQWLNTNFKKDFIPAWYCTFHKGPYKNRQDLSVITTPDSRMNNFYLEGLDWMCKEMKIDGIYIDDSALDRITLKRARKILEANRPKPNIDFHTWNHFNEHAGFACCLNLYMDLLPYVDMLWIGEGRNYDRSPDYWLIETVGIPFGVPSQMLQDGGNPWRGMVFGMTNRLGWHGATPEYIWKFVDEYKIKEKDMIGFWDDATPVKTSNPEMVATFYKGDDTSIIAIANWTPKSQSGRLEIDWDKLGMDEKNVKIEIPYLKEFQEAVSLQPNQKLNIEGGKGYLIVIQEK